MPDPSGGGFGLAWKVAKDVKKCDGTCDCPDCSKKNKQTDKGAESA